MKKAFAFSCSLMSLALYLIGGNGAYGSFGYFATDAWDAVKSIFFAALSIGISLFELVAAVLCFVFACIVGVGTLAYAAAYYVVIALIDAAKWFFTADWLYIDADYDYLDD